MAAPVRQLSCLVFSRLLRPKTPVYNSLVVQSCASSPSLVRNKPVQSFEVGNPRRDISIRLFCSDVKSGSGIDNKVPVESSTSKETTFEGASHQPNNGSPIKTESPGVSHSSPLKSQTDSGTSSGISQESSGGVKFRSESLYDLASDLDGAIDSQDERLQNKEFYRRRMQSEWSPDKTFKGYREEDSSEFVYETPFDKANREHDPTYFYGFATVMCFSAVMAFTFLKKKEQEDTIELLIAKSWASEGEGDLSKADALLHKALHMAQDKNNTDAITYIYDQLANLAMRHGNLSKAEGLFKETLKRMISSGTPQEDSAVIEISLKLARMYDKMRRYSDSEQGFRWCITTAEKRLAEAKDKESKQNLQSLLGMCLDCYARSLAAHDRLQEAKDTYQRALNICEKELMVDGIPHPQTIILLNDLGTVYDLGGQYDEAVEYIQRAVDLAEKRSPSDLPTVLCNLASVHMHAARFDEARTHYKRALSMAERQSDNVAILEIKNSLAQLQTNEYLKAEKLKAPEGKNRDETSQAGRG